MSDKILLSHGGGGEEMNALIDKLIFKIFKNDLLNSAVDAAILPKMGRNLAFTTDSFVVIPRFFNGGNIGKIAICGTINDLAMSGARALYISCALIIEEGFSIDELEIILKSMCETADLAGVKIVCGDTKVVPIGKCDGIFINTSGIGEIYDDTNVNAKRLQSGQKIVLSGDIGRHGAVILAARDEIALESE
ncbi:MAG: hydrogenase expression/formation protein HypE, partial [Campylobacter sp.]